MRQEASFDAALRHAYATAYNLDHDEAVRELTTLANSEPDLPTTYRALASITWLRLLFSRGTVLVDEYLGRISKRDVQMAAATAGRGGGLFALYVAGHFTCRGAGDCAIRATAVHSTTSVRRSACRPPGRPPWRGGWAARSVGATCLQDAEQASVVSPDDPDPRLILGTYRYVVSGLNLPTRMVAYMAGLDGDRARGLQMVEQAAASASPVRTEARFALILLYNRETALGRRPSACWPRCATCTLAIGCCG